MNKYLVALFKLTFENRIGFRFGKRQVGEGTANRTFSM